MIKSWEDIQSGYVVRFRNGDAVLCDGLGGGWIIVGCGSDKMYHTSLKNTAAYTLTNKANNTQWDIDLIINCRNEPIQKMVDIVSDSSKLNNYSTWIVWSRDKFEATLNEIYSGI